MVACMMQYLTYSPWIIKTQTFSHINATLPKNQVCEKEAYGRANGAFLYALFSYLYIDRLLLNWTGNEFKMFWKMLIQYR